MKFIVQTVVVDVNAFRNSGCAMEIGNEKNLEFSFENNLCSILVIVMMEAMKIVATVVSEQAQICLVLKFGHFYSVTPTSTLLQTK